MHRLYCLSVVGSLRYSLAFYRVSPREFLVNWETMTAPIVNKNLHFEDCFKVHKTFIQNKKMIVTIYHMERCVGFLGILKAFGC